ncbi:MAG TPA: threonine dehydratase [Pseudomonas sp.]|nr:threonine dehydratase [Pseudomonas sp.]
MQLSLTELEAAAAIVHASMSPTAQLCWPLLCEAVGTELWVKHENHAPTGAFKVRGGLVYFQRLQAQGNSPTGVVSATRGNHGQSVGFAARRAGIPAHIVVPHGNSREKNAAMRALGVRLIEAGEDFQAAREQAALLADREGLHMIPSFHPDLVAGVASYSLELFQSLGDIDVAYVPIGLGSGICGMIAARDALGLRTQIVGVVSQHAPAYALSFAAGQAREHPVSTLLADGMACRATEPAALAMILRGVERIVSVDDREVGQAMGLYFTATHNVSEGAGAAPLAAALQERDRLKGKRVALVLSGANVDRELFAAQLV